MLIILHSQYIYNIYRFFIDDTKLSQDYHLNI